MSDQSLSAAERGPECPSCGVPFDQHDGFAEMCVKLASSTEEHEYNQQRLRSALAGLVDAVKPFIEGLPQRVVPQSIYNAIVEARVQLHSVGPIPADTQGET